MKPRAQLLLALLQEIISVYCRSQSELLLDCSHHLRAFVITRASPVAWDLLSPTLHRPGKFFSSCPRFAIARSCNGLSPITVPCQALSCNALLPSECHSSSPLLKDAAAHRQAQLPLELSITRGCSDSVGTVCWYQLVRISFVNLASPRRLPL